ncbi:hypothetical protein CTA2_11590 [Colletotrichum tanaceti]|nr:hypothetical protein CTA2_11590 [Colletotrichum tanaceti]
MTPVFFRFCFFGSLKRLLPCSPPNAHVGSHDEVQHLEALWVDDQLAELGSLAAIAAAGPFLSEPQVERARRLVLVAVLAVAVAAADLEQPAKVAAELLPLALLPEQLGARQVEAQLAHGGRVGRRGGRRERVAQAAGRRQDVSALDAAAGVARAELAAAVPRRDEDVALGTQAVARLRDDGARVAAVGGDGARRVRAQLARVAVVGPRRGRAEVRRRGRQAGAAIVDAAGARARAQLFAYVGGPGFGVGHDHLPREAAFGGLPLQQLLLLLHVLEGVFRVGKGRRAHGVSGRVDALS